MQRGGGTLTERGYGTSRGRGENPQTFDIKAPGGPGLGFLAVRKSFGGGGSRNGIATFGIHYSGRAREQRGFGVPKEILASRRDKEE